MLTLEAASIIVDKALEKGRELGFKPLTVAVLDAGGQLKALKREDGSSLLRPEIAGGKAWGPWGWGSAAASSPAAPPPIPPSSRRSVRPRAGSCRASARCRSTRPYCPDPSCTPRSRRANCRSAGTSEQGSHGPTSGFRQDRSGCRRPDPPPPPRKPASAPEGRWGWVATF